jgi:threonine synthase
MTGVVRAGGLKIVLVAVGPDLAEAWRHHLGDLADVSIFGGDIIEAGCDAVVSPANSFGFMDGGIDAVSEQEITDGIALLAETTGIFTETAGGVTTAVLKRLADRGEIGPDERVVIYITGDGLKTLDAVAERVEPVVINPTVSDFEAAVDGRGVALPA